MNRHPGLGHGAQTLRKPIEIGAAQFEIVRVRDTACARRILEPGWERARNYPDTCRFEGRLDLPREMLGRGRHQCGTFDKWPQLSAVCGSGTGLVGRMSRQVPEEVIYIEYIRNILSAAQAEQGAKCTGA